MGLRLLVAQTTRLQQTLGYSDQPSYSLDPQFPVSRESSRQRGLNPRGKVAQLPPECVTTLLVVSKVVVMGTSMPTVAPFRIGWTDVTMTTELAKLNDSASASGSVNGRTGRGKWFVEVPGRGRTRSAHGASQRAEIGVSLSSTSPEVVVLPRLADWRIRLVWDALRRKRRDRLSCALALLQLRISAGWANFQIPCVAPAPTRA